MKFKNGVVEVDVAQRQRAQSGRSRSSATNVDLVATPNQVGANEVSFQATPRHTKSFVTRSWSLALVTLPLERKGNCGQQTVVKMQILKCPRECMECNQYQYIFDD